MTVFKGERPLGPARRVRPSRSCAQECCERLWNGHGARLGFGRLLVDCLGQQRSLLFAQLRDESVSSMQRRRKSSSVVEEDIVSGNRCGAVA